MVSKSMLLSYWVMVKCIIMSLINCALLINCVLSHSMLLSCCLWLSNIMALVICATLLCFYPQLVVLLAVLFLPWWTCVYINSLQMNSLFHRYCNFNIHYIHIIMVSSNGLFEISITFFLFTDYFVYFIPIFNCVI